MLEEDRIAKVWRRIVFGFWWHLGFLTVLLSFIGKLKRNDIGDEISLEWGGRSRKTFHL
jgi:hypothetical protein